MWRIRARTARIIGRAHDSISALSIYKCALKRLLLLTIIHSIAHRCFYLFVPISISCIRATRVTKITFFPLPFFAAHFTGILFGYDVVRGQKLSFFFLSLFFHSIRFLCIYLYECCVCGVFFFLVFSHRTYGRFVAFSLCSFHSRHVFD